MPSQFMQDTGKKAMLFACMGLISGLVNGSSQFFLPDVQFIIDFYPAVFLGIFLFLAGKYLLYPDNKKQFLSLLILIIFSALGWRLSVNYGYMWGGPAPYGNAGAVGAFFVALGWLFSWRIHSGFVLFLAIITIAGTAGGLIFQVIDTTIKMSETLWIFVLFVVWQIMLFLGIALASSLKINK